MKCLAMLVILSLSISLMARAPMTIGYDVAQPKNDFKNIKNIKTRYPAQLDLAPLDNYLDMDCHDFFDKSNPDEFVISFRLLLSELAPHFCDQVKDINFEDDISQAQRTFVGPGTFSKLLEAHYNEFKYAKQLKHYLSMECRELIDINSRDDFRIFFRRYIVELNPNMCELVGPMSSGRGDLFLPDQKTIGSSTFSKIVEEAFNDYYFSYRQ